MAQEEGERHCSFCRKQRADVAYLIAGPAEVFICDQCVALCSEIMADEIPAVDDRAAITPQPWWRFWER